MKIVNRIKKSDEFALTIKKGKAKNNNSFTVHYIDNDLGYARVGISASKKLGNAVVRSKIRRQIREMCHSLINFNEINKDIVIIARFGFLNNDFHQNEQLLKELLIF